MGNLSLADSIFSDRHLTQGINYQRQNMLQEALFEYDTALSLTPNDRYANWNHATTLLALGEYEEGFKEYDRAWSLFDLQGFGPVNDDILRIKHLPIWTGEDISNSRLLIYHELGFGDGIQCMRYLPELKRRAAHVTLVINTELVRLAEPFGVEVVDKVPVDIGDYDYRVSFFSVLSALRQTLHNIPADPYIKPTKLRAMSRGYRAGICWSGRTQTAFTLDYFLSKFEHQKFELHSLQLGLTNERVERLTARDFAETADVIADMDFVVTIDSAVAHLSGAMGKPTHLLLPFLMDWRWWFTQTWYPTIKTYKQMNVGDWNTPFTKLNEALRGN